MADTQSDKVNITAARDGDKIVLKVDADFTQVAAMAQTLSGENYSKVHAILKPGESAGFQTGKDDLTQMGPFISADSVTGVLKILGDTLEEGSFFASDRNYMKAIPFTLEGVRQATMDARAIAQEIAKGKQ